MRRLPLPLTIALAAALAPCAPSQGGDNVLLIIADDLGVDGVGAYGEGSNPPLTPTIDALAARGLLFRNAWANPVCSPTRAGIHTGRYSLRTFVGQAIVSGANAPLRPREITLPEALDLGGSGYAHALIGKWHLGTKQGSASPNVAGWGHFAGMLNGQINYFNWSRTVDGVTRPSFVYSTTQMVDDALAWIQGQSTPWLCVLAFNAPHTPIHRPPARLHTQSLPAGVPETNPVPFFRATVEAMDTEIGRLLDTLGPVVADTNIVFVGDNGAIAAVTSPPFVRTHGKSTPYEGGLNVPLIVAGPAVAAPNREEGALVSTVDLFSTVLELCGVDAGDVVPPWVTLDAVSMAPYLANSAPAALRDTVYAEKFSGTDWSTMFQDGFSAVRDPRYKLIRSYDPSGSAEEMYDLLLDPFESTDLLTGALTSDLRDRRAALAARIDDLRSPAGAFHVFGTRTCAGSAGVPGISAAGEPALGDSYSVFLENGVPGGAAVLLLGASATTWGGTPLPFDLAGIGGGPGCWLWSSGDVVLARAIDEAGVAGLEVDVPDSTALIERVVFHSWLVLDVEAPGNRLGLTASNAAAAVVGF